MDDCYIPREEFGVAAAQAEGLVDFLYAFELRFRRHLAQQFKQLGDSGLLMGGAIGTIIDQYMDSCAAEDRASKTRTLELQGLPTTRNFILAQSAPSFNQYRSHLEKACAAAQQLESEYDLCVGIAKKGMWLSYVFAMHRVPLYDVLVVRNGDNRFIAPLTTKSTSDKYRGKRILLMDNDVVTGGTVKVLVEKLAQAEPASIDLLLVYRDTEITPSHYEMVKRELRTDHVVRGEYEGDVVLDATSQLEGVVGKVMSLQHDFEVERKSLKVLARKLKVNI